MYILSKLRKSHKCSKNFNKTFYIKLFVWSGEDYVALLSSWEEEVFLQREMQCSCPWMWVCLDGALVVSDDQKPHHSHNAYISDKHTGSSSNGKGHREAENPTASSICNNGLYSKQWITSEVLCLTTIALAGTANSTLHFFPTRPFPRSGDALHPPDKLDEAIALRLNAFIRQRKIINAFSHDYTIQPSNSCAGRQIDLVMGVTVPADDFVARGQYRSLIADNDSMSWSEKPEPCRFFYRAAGPNQRPEGRSAIDTRGVEEIQNIVQGDYPDNPGNLNAKTMSMLRWVTKNCPFAKFVLNGPFR
ncbi:hypothetical protein Btru_042249 [Bulinus truncatus]|nr:hypothetical protein Btru_042249 [Bulinus truncatus]